MGLGPIHAIEFAADDRTFVVGGKNGASIWSLETRSRQQALSGNRVLAVAYSPRGDYVLSWDERYIDLGFRETFVGMWAVDSGKMVGEFQSHNKRLHPTGFSGEIGLMHRMASMTTPLKEPNLDRSCPPIAFSPDGSSLLFADDNNAVLIGDHLTPGRHVFVGHTGPVQTVAFSPDGKMVATGSWDGTARLWHTKDAREIARMVSLADGTWLVHDADGRFDTNELDRIIGLHWLFPDDSFRGLAPEIFLRDYYEPRLLSRILSGETPRPVRRLSTLNRAQPGISNLKIEPGVAHGEVRVTGTLSKGLGEFQRDGQRLTLTTKIYDLRLFRDGQLVGRWPVPTDESDGEKEIDPESIADMQTWRTANEVTPDGRRVKLVPGREGRLTIDFPVKLPHHDRQHPIEFAAYAFNEDRVKSETARLTYQAPAQPATRKPRAYLVCVGVSACQTKAWDLTFAAKDAEAIAASLDSALKDRYDVVPVMLTSQYAEEGTVASALATKENLHAVLDLLAGKQVDAAIHERLPRGSELQMATPDDLVLVSFSGHGYTDKRGALHLIPYDVGSGQKSVTDAQSRCISSGELSAWLRGVDAGETVLVVDACHSAAAITEPGFKPGPLGNRGLGQLAYDKGMRVLAAAQGDDVALESRKVKQGLLTYALIRDGLEQQRAAKDGKITLGGLLTYAAERVPSLYEEVVAGKVKDAAGETAKDVDGVQPKDPSKSRAQRPELFDYAKKRPDISLNTESASR